MESRRRDTGGSCTACLSPVEMAVTRMRIVDTLVWCSKGVQQRGRWGLEVIDSQGLALAQPKASGGRPLALLGLWLAEPPPVLGAHPHCPYLGAA